MFSSVALAAVFLFALTTSALPAQEQPSVDPCGPTISAATDPKDTCHSAPPIVAADQGPRAFGITKVPVRVGQAVGGYWEICSGLISEICDAMVFTALNQ